MVLPLAAALALATQCAPAVAPETLLSVVTVESALDPLVIGVNVNPHRQLHPRSVPEAIATAHRLLAGGANLDLGLAQINARNLTTLGLSLATVFDPCRNLGAAAELLRRDFTPIAGDLVAQQAALRLALSRYNTGDPRRGLANGYVAKVERAAAVLVPALRPTLPDEGDGHTAPAPPSPPTWAVFAATPATFVLSPKPDGTP